MAKQMNVVVTLSVAVQDDNTGELLDRSPTLEKMVKRWLTEWLTDERVRTLDERRENLLAVTEDVKVTIFPEKKE